MTTLIKNGIVYNGTSDSSEKTDILIQNDKIARVGSLGKINADETIDASGSMVFPGFIDINTHSDHYFSIFKDPFQEDFILNGITTIIGGNCGESLAPFSPLMKEAPTDWGYSGISRSNIHWNSVKELFRVLKKKKFGVNFGTLIGYTSLREYITGGTQRDLTLREIKIAEEITKDALREGVFGLSSGFENHRESSIPYSEISHLLDVVAKENRIYATHLKHFGTETEKSVFDTIEMTKRANVKTQISHLIPREKYEHTYTRAKELIEKELATFDITFDIPMSRARTVPIHSFLPNWVHDEHVEKMVSHFDIPHMRKRIFTHVSEYDFANTYFSVVPTFLSSLAGKSVRDVAQNFGMSEGETIVYLANISRMTILCSVENRYEELWKDFILSPASLISSSDASMPRNEFTRGKKEKLLRMLISFSRTYGIPIERIIPKLTSIPAAKYGIDKRGRIKEGYYADVLIVKNEDISDVFVNGVRAIKNGILSNIKCGGKVIIPR